MNLLHRGEDRRRALRPERLRFASLWLAVTVMACGALPSAPAEAAVDGERAMELIKAQCDFGPRIPGSDAHDKCRQWIVKQFEDLGWKVIDAPFHVRLPLSGQEATAHNLWVLPVADGPTSPALLLSAHWDTRPWADNEPGGGRPPMLGANDGASGVAMLIEIARELRDDPLKPQVAMALWDAEDAGVNNGPEETWCLGSRQAAAHPPAWIGRVKMGLNFDMIAGSEFAARMDIDSLEAAPQAMRALWRIGHDLHPNRFQLDQTYEIIDDHIPWIDAGVPYIDLLGLPYAYWHRVGDKPDNCSAATLAAVGEVAMIWIRQKPWLRPGGTLPGVRVR